MGTDISVFLPRSYSQTAALQLFSFANVCSFFILSGYSPLINMHEHSLPLNCCCLVMLFFL